MVNLQVKTKKIDLGQGQVRLGQERKTEKKEKEKKRERKKERERERERENNIINQFFLFQIKFITHDMKAIHIRITTY